MADSDAEVRRLLLHNDILEFTGHAAFYQPPPSVKLTYPCTIYNLNSIYVNSADDMSYKKMRRYQLTYITKDPTDPLVDKFLEHFKMISFSRPFVSDNLYHYVYDLYY